MPGVLEKNPDVRVLLVGGGPREDHLRKRVGELGLNEVVIFTRRVLHDTVQAYYNLADLFVYPRLPMRLTDLVTPLKPLEAMAQGRLALASDVGGHRELINPGVNGELFRAVMWLTSPPLCWTCCKTAVAGSPFVRVVVTLSSPSEPGQRSVARYDSVYATVLG